MFTDKKDGFIFEENKNYRALWINSLVQSPLTEKPLHHYTTEKQGGKRFFYRLYEVTYQQEGILNHKILEWREVSVKSYGEQALIAILEIVKSIEEFLY